VKSLIVLQLHSIHPILNYRMMIIFNQHLRQLFSVQKIIITPRKDRPNEAK
jgi:hypothetical protein